MTLKRGVERLSGGWGSALGRGLVPVLPTSGLLPASAHRRPRCR